MDLPEQVRSCLSSFVIPREKLDQIRDAMSREFQLGLEVGSPPSSVGMLPTFVPALPDGTETGEYLTLDLSGKNLRVLLLRLHGRGKRYETEKHNYMVPKEIMVGTGAQVCI
uniref:Phosphotransferase n=1 Tax=Romanomermis culicivorax TaxID=13658 RepID=A0A915IIV9_ROMCU